MRIASSLATTIILFMTVPAAANLQPANQTIVVRGTPLNPEQARQRAVDFVKSTGVANGQKQVARWVVPVCIKVIGVSTPQAGEGRRTCMLGVAREANIPVARPGCEPNITVTFAADAGQVVRHIHQREPHQLRELSPTRARAIAERNCAGSLVVRNADARSRRREIEQHLCRPGLRAGEGRLAVP